MGKLLIKNQIVLLKNSEVEHIGRKVICEKVNRMF